MRMRARVSSSSTKPFSHAHVLRLKLGFSARLVFKLLETLNMSFTEEEATLPPCKYEYLDHTADVQLHAWGDDLQEAFEQCAMAMFAYMTDIEYVDLKEAHDIEAQGDDLESLLFHFLDEFLFLFSCEPFLIARKVKILEFDRENFRIKARGYGEPFELGRHPQGTEVKAITYSNMQIHDNDDKHEVFVIIDI